MKGLDRYLTSEPRDDYAWWLEVVTDYIPGELFLRHEEKIYVWCSYLHIKRYKAQEAATLIIKTLRRLEALEAFKSGPITYIHARYKR